LAIPACGLTVVLDRGVIAVTATLRARHGLEVVVGFDDPPAPRF